MPLPDPLSADWSQPHRGYRFSQDSVLLAHSAPQFLAGIAADFGAGCGVVGLEALAAGRLRGADGLYLVEAQPLFSPFLKYNAQRARRLVPDSPPLKILVKDWRALKPEDLGGKISYLTANPPYFAPGRGRSPREERLWGREERRGGLSSLLRQAAALLAPQGALSLSWPRARLPELLAGLSAHSFAPSSFAFPSRRGDSLILLQALWRPKG
ncbi:MAG: hypothetical protein LBO66_05895 [Deltaproteobacteria bacterium]|nr:hypothetical protein [Deltaproteobacteria bacterium]